MQKVILFYKFAPIPDPEAIKLWQYALASSLGLTGRIIVSTHGINGTLGGDMMALKKYVRALRSYSGFKGTEIKWSDGSAEDFPRLSVKARKEMVTFGVPDEVQVGDDGVIGGGPHLKPVDIHKLVEEKPETVFFDGRNAFEAEVGRFKNAIVPNVETTREFIEELESGKYDHLKQTPIVTYCTGGIRCEILSALMLERGFEEVYQIDGGIVRYGERFGNKGLWEGALYVFDRRGIIEFGDDDAKVIGTCVVCGEPTNWIGDCADLSCLKQMPSCRDCTPVCDDHAAPVG